MPARPIGTICLTQRAVWYRTYKGDFTNEPFRSLRNHLYDNFAFHEEELRKNWTAKDIADRLNFVYNNLHILYFTTLPDDDIKHWVDGMPPDVAKILVNSDKFIDYGRARGMFHRMFVRGLDEMSADEITAWRQTDPSISTVNPTDYKQDDESAMIAMEILYEGPDVKHLPRLVNSPLHWPLRENRAKRGNKRDREADEEPFINNDEPIDDDGEVDVPPTIGPGPIKKPKVNEGPKEPDASTPADAPSPAEDPNTVNWITITDVNLANHQYITLVIRGDPRVGPNANNYTYRALLFLQHSGTFKKDSPYLPMDL
jgi:hypothetical protein